MELQWTPEAEETLSAFFKRHWDKLCPEGANPAEVHENIRLHISEDASASGAKLITAERLNLSLVGLVPDADSITAAPAVAPLPEPVLEPDVPTKSPAFLRRGAGRTDQVKPLTGWFLFFGVILPIGVVAFELVSHACAGVLFDPIPTWWHTMIVAFVPITNFLIFRRSRGEGKHRPRLLPILAGMSMLFALYYAALFAPVSPLAFIGIIYFGFGLVPLSPIFAFLASLFGNLKLGTCAIKSGTSPTSHKRRFWAGVGIAFLILLILEAPRYATRIALDLATSKDADTHRKSVQFLRAFGSESTLLRSCYESSRFGFGSGDASSWVMNGLGGSVTSPDEARRIYFEVTGTPFNYEKPPRMNSRGASGAFAEGAYRFDEDQGGKEVGARLMDLDLKSSRIDTHVDPDSALAYTEWTLVFSNERPRPAEGRFQALLPPGGVVSRLTLWVNGEPQEAAFAATAKVRAAYEKVAIAQRRDPVLVTSSGPDRVLVQCFPIPADGEMKIRIGITSPLHAAGTDSNTGATWMPQIVERNFNIAKKFEHSIWVQSPETLSCELEGLGSEKGEGGKAHALSGTLSDTALNKDDTRITAGGIDFSTAVWTTDPFQEGTKILRTTTEAKVSPHRHLVIALDTSTGMSEGWEPLKTEIEKFAKSNPCTLVIADDEISTHTGNAGISSALDGLRARGGKDNATALLEALRVARQHEDSAVVWIHAAQPFLLADSEGIAQTLERSFTRRPIYSYAVDFGPDLVTGIFFRNADIHAAPRGIGVGDYLDQLVTTGSTAGAKPKYERLDADQETPQGAKEVWDHLARYWAYDQAIANYHDLDAPGMTPEFAALAAKYQLVTPFSGAVVLETKQDYVDAGLEQVDPASTPSIPTIPEPGTTSLLLLTLAALTLRRRRPG